jgi:hypothetical protein
LKTFFTTILGEENYVNRIEYIRREHGRSTYALLGIRSCSRSAFLGMTGRLEKAEVEYREVGKEDFLFKYWV